MDAAIFATMAALWTTVARARRPGRPRTLISDPSLFARKREAVVKGGADDLLVRSSRRRGAAEAHSSVKKDSTASSPYSPLPFPLPLPIHFRRS
jgi:hypothetical protein